MNNLFVKRLQLHLTQMSRYLKYVFNDFFVIALMFFIGGLGYEYSQLIKKIKPDLWWQSPLAIIVLMLGLQLGSLITLVKEADYVFWMPKEQSFLAFFKKGLTYSSWISGAVQLFIWFLLIPFITKSEIITNKWNLLLLFLLLLCIKRTMLVGSFIDNYKGFQYSSLLYRLVIPLVLLVIAMYRYVWVSMILVILLLVFLMFLTKPLKNYAIDWKHVIDTQHSHENVVNRFFNMFTDVPGMQGSVKRRRYLDFIFKWFDRDVYSLLYARGIIRDKEISGLLFRLTILGTILMLAINNKIMVTLLGMIFIYLMVFQLIPFFDNFSDNVFMHIYPISEESRVKSFSNDVIKILIPVVILFTAASIYSVNILFALFVFVVLILELILLTKIYVTKKIKKRV